MSARPAQAGLCVTPAVAAQNPALSCMTTSSWPRRPVRDIPPGLSRPSLFRSPRAHQSLQRLRQSGARWPRVPERQLQHFFDCLRHRLRRLLQQRRACTARRSPTTPVPGLPLSLHSSKPLYCGSSTHLAQPPVPHCPAFVRTRFLGLRCRRLRRKPPPAFATAPTPNPLLGAHPPWLSGARAQPPPGATAPRPPWLRFGSANCGLPSAELGFTAGTIQPPQRDDLHRHLQTPGGTAPQSGSLPDQEVDLCQATAKGRVHAIPFGAGRTIRWSRWRVRRNVAA